MKFSSDQTTYLIENKYYLKNSLFSLGREKNIFKRLQKIDITTCHENNLNHWLGEKQGLKGDLFTIYLIEILLFILSYACHIKKKTKALAF